MRNVDAPAADRRIGDTGRRGESHRGNRRRDCVKSDGRGDHDPSDRRFRRGRRHPSGAAPQKQAGSTTESLWCTHSEAVISTVYSLLYTHQLSDLVIGIDLLIRTER